MIYLFLCKRSLSHIPRKVGMPHSLWSIVGVTIIDLRLPSHPRGTDGQYSSTIVLGVPESEWAGMAGYKPRPYTYFHERLPIPVLTGLDVE